ncbi:MAG: ATP-binding protein [Myxococcota bacterium]
MKINLAGRWVPAAVYIGPIGESHRKRSDERRFQNPGQDRPISDVDGGVPLLLGVWNPEDDREAVLVAFDAYRRVGLRTRFSMFLPASLLDDAQAEGSAEHESTSGELIQAFPVSRLCDYLGTLFDPGLIESANTTNGSRPLAVSDATSSSAVHIRPKVGMYAAFARLNYKPWFALAEFVDNAVQSYLAHRSQLGEEPLQVDIRIDDTEIVVSDRAAGIPWSQFPRAFSPSQPPPDPSGLSEFGLGMKAAACWFANTWSVRTSALGDPVERQIRFDVARITQAGIEHLEVEQRPAPADSHYTIVTLSNPRVRLRTRTLSKIKAHLSSIYRILMEKGLVKLTVESASKKEQLSFSRRDVLEAPYFREPNEKPRIWKKTFHIDLGGEKKITGWAALLEKGSASRAGLSVFRRDRLIQGSDDEAYRPLRLFRSPNSYTYQRLIGELHVEGFDVSHTKDGIQWGGLEHEMLSRLKTELNSDDLPLLKQAEGYRVRQKARELPTTFGAEALQGAGAELRGNGASQTLAQPLDAPSEATTNSTLENKETEPEEEARELQGFETTVRVLDEEWRVRLKLVSDASLDWYGVEDVSAEGGTHFDVWINLGHPFSESYVNSDENTLGPVVRLVAAMALAEQAAFRGGVRRASMLRHKVNGLLREHFGTLTGEDGATG